MVFPEKSYIASFPSLPSPPRNTCRGNCARLNSCHSWQRSSNGDRQPFKMQLVVTENINIWIILWIIYIYISVIPVTFHYFLSMSSFSGILSKWQNCLICPIWRHHMYHMYLCRPAAFLFSQPGPATKAVHFSRQVQSLQCLSDCVPNTMSPWAIARQEDVIRMALMPWKRLTPDVHQDYINPGSYDVSSTVPTTCHR